MQSYKDLEIYNRIAHNAQRIARSAVLIGIIFLSVGQLGAENATLTGTSDWNIKKSKHFIVYYQESPGRYISKVTSRAEHYYRSITDYLGLRRFKFWTWDKRCKIYLYPDQQEYLDKTSSISWSRGGVHVIRKEIITYVRDEEFFDYVLPHEMGHIIFRETIGFDKKIPLWLDEAVAVLQEKDRDGYLAIAARLVKEGDYIPLDELSGIRGYKSIDSQVFYSESASIIDFLLNKYGRDTFVTFCRRLRDGEEWEKALLKTYRFEDLEELQEAWVNHLLK